MLLPGIGKQRNVVVDMGESAAPTAPLWRRILRALNPTTWAAALSSHFGHGAGSLVEGSKRKLIRDNRDTVTLTVPFLVWGAVVIIVYTYSYMRLKTVSRAHGCIISIRSRHHLLVCRTVLRFGAHPAQ